MASKLESYFASPVKRGADGKEYRLSETSVSFGEALTLKQLVRNSVARDPMEVGLALGASAVAIAEALEEQGGPGRLVTLDPFQEAFGNVGLGELDRLTLRHRVEFLPAFGEDFLYETSKTGRRFDFIFIDGGHSIGSKMTNTFFADRCLTANGTLAFHDAFMASTTACVEYLIRERAYQPIALPPDSAFKRWARMVKYGVRRSPWYSRHVTPFTHRSLVALRKTEKLAPSR